MIKKFKLTNKIEEHYGITFHQIEYLKDFADIKKGDLGGWIEKEDNLSQEDNARVYGNARVSENARVYGNARVYKKIKLIGGYFYHTKQKSEKIEMVDTYNDDYETLARNPEIEPFEEQKPVGKKVKIKIDGGQALEGELVD
mgnify:CR=1 FL=1